MGRLVLITANASRLLTVAQAKAHCRCQNDAENDLFTGWIQAAFDYCQRYTSRAILTSTWQYIDCGFPADDEPIDLLISPVQSITSIEYVDTDADDQTLDDEDYQLDAQDIAPKIYVGPESSWPLTQLGKVSAVTVEFIAGYTSIALVPAQFGQAMLLIIGNWYKNREDPGIPAAANYLLDQLICERYV